MKTILVFSCILFINPVTIQAQDFSAFSQILKNNLIEENLPSGGYQTSFDYTKAKTDPRTDKLLATQKQILKNFDVKKLNDKRAANAFWINAYNFFMIHIILSQGFENSKLKIKSVKDFGSFFSPYRIFKKEINDVGGHKMSLDDIEKGILLGKDYAKKGWKDARIHFAVNCASVGCPPLIPAVYSAENLDNKLDTNIKKALKTHRHFHINNKEIYLTHLFKWYAKDFEEHSGSIKAFLKKYIEDAAILKNLDSVNDFEFITYDWNLNHPENFK